MKTLLLIIVLMFGVTSCKKDCNCKVVTTMSTDSTPLSSSSPKQTTTINYNVTNSTKETATKVCDGYDVNTPYLKSEGTLEW